MDSQRKNISSNKAALKIYDKLPFQPDSRTHKKTEKAEKPRCKSGLGKHKQAKPKTNSNERQINALLKESYQLLKQENQGLSHTLRRKTTKMEQMKATIKIYQARLSCYEEMAGLLKNRGETSTETEEPLNASTNKIQEMIKEAQDIAKASVDKYKKIERDIQEERKIHKEQINRLKQQNKKLKTQPQIAQSACKNRTKSSSYKQRYEDLEAQLNILKVREAEWQKKQQNLRTMLAQISCKVDSYEKKCRASEQRAKLYRLEIDSWKEKYESKCKKSKESNQKWRMLFGDLMKQTVDTKKEIEAVKKILIRLIKKQSGYLTYQ